MAPLNPFYPLNPYPTFPTVYDTNTNDASEQNLLLKHDNLSATESNSTITVNMSKAQNQKMMSLWSQRRDDLLADVEKPLLEAAKQPELVGTSINGGAWFDPKGVSPTATFKETLRPVYRIDETSTLIVTGADPLAKEDNYLYDQQTPVQPARDYQKYYYKNNPHKDATGRVTLFDRQFTRNFV